jgi:hypothetical protein
MEGQLGGNNQPVGFKVVNIRGARAQVEYTHNGHTERGFGQVSGALISSSHSADCRRLVRRQLTLRRERGKDADAGRGCGIGMAACTRPA